MPILFHCPWSSAPDWQERLTRLTGVACIGPHAPAASDAEVAVVWKAPRYLFETARSLRLICSLGAGVDHIVGHADALPAGVRISRLVDPVMSRRMAVYALSAILRYHRYFDLFASHQRSAAWVRHEGPDPEGYRVGVLGQGEIGVTVAHLLKMNGFAVAGWARSEKPELDWPISVGSQGLDALLPTLDAVVLVLPLTAETHGLVNRAFLAKMKPGAVLINESRGEHVVEPDLIAALDKGHLHGATLDAFAVEPLPPESPLWSHPKVFVTPHIAGLSNPATGAVAIAEEIGRFLGGQPLKHEVHLDRGY